MDRQRRRHEPPKTEPSDLEAVADRLQQLSAEEIERVVRRAIEIQIDRDTTQPALFDSAALTNVAEELGIDGDHLRAAMVEEMIRLETEEPNWLDRLVAPDRIAAWGTIEGGRAAIRAVLDQWMTAHQGLVKIEEAPTGSRWIKDNRLGTRLRHGLGRALGDRSLRSVDSVRDSIRPITDEQSLVTVEADTSNLRQLATGLLVAAAAAGIAVAGVTDIVDASGFGVGNVAAGVGAFGVLAGGVWLGVRMWANRIRRGLERVIGAVARPPRTEQTRPVWSVLDEVLGLADDVRSAFVFRHRR